MSVAGKESEPPNAPYLPGEAGDGPTRVLCLGFRVWGLGFRV